MLVSGGGTGEQFTSAVDVLGEAAGGQYDAARGSYRVRAIRTFEADTDNATVIVSLQRCCRRFHPNLDAEIER